MKKRDFEDDGRQIADMSDTYRSWYGMRMQRRKPKKKAVPINEDENFVPIPEPELTKKEQRSLIANAMLAALALGLVFIGAAFAFIWFCVNIWFK